MPHSLPPGRQVARVALVGRLSGAGGAALDWIGRPGAPDRPDRAELGGLLVRWPRATLKM